MYNKALVAVDGSETSLGAVALAMDMLQDNYIKSVVLLYVHKTVLNWSTYSIVNTRYLTEEEFIRDMQKKGRQILAPALQLFEKCNLPVESIVELGNAEEGIIRIAREHNCDLIIVGNRGLSKIGEIVYGSTSQKVLHLSPVPVIVFKPGFSGAEAAGFKKAAVKYPAD